MLMMMSPIQGAINYGREDKMGPQPQGEQNRPPEIPQKPREQTRTNVRKNAQALLKMLRYSGYSLRS
jgi:hypothetical protein